MMCFDDSYASATHAAEVGNGGLTPPCPMRGALRRAGRKPAPVAEPYASAIHIAEVADPRLTLGRLKVHECGVMPPRAKWLRLVIC